MNRFDLGWKASKANERRKNRNEEAVEKSEIHFQHLLLHIPRFFFTFLLLLLFLLLLSWASECR